MTAEIIGDEGGVHTSTNMALVETEPGAPWRSDEVARWWLATGRAGAMSDGGVGGSRAPVGVGQRELSGVSCCLGQAAPAALSFPAERITTTRSIGSAGS